MNIPTTATNRHRTMHPPLQTDRITAIYDRHKQEVISMPATEQITVTLPSEIIEIIRAKVASGEYASESDFVCHSLVMSEAHRASESDAGWWPSDEWLIQHALPALDELETHPETGIPLEEVEAELLRRRRSRQEQAA